MIENYEKEMLVKNTFGHVEYFLKRYGSLYNIYYRFDPTDLIVVDNMEDLCLVIENDLLSMEWRLYFAGAATFPSPNLIAIAMIFISEV